REGDRGADGFDADLLARLALAAFARLFAFAAAEVPAERFAQHLGDEHQQIRMRVRHVQLAARASSARPVDERTVVGLAQPALGERERELELADAARAMDEE